MGDTRRVSTVPPSPPRPDAFTLRSLVWSIYAPSFLFALGVGAVVPVIPLFARDLGAGDGLVGVIVAMRAIGTTVLDVPAGVAATRFGHRTTIGGAGVLLVGAGVVGALSGGSAELALAVFIIGAGAGLFMTARLAFMAERVPLARRGRALSLIGGTHRIGLFVGPVIGGFISQAWGLETAFIMQAVATALAVGMVLAFMPKTLINEPLHTDANMYARLGRTLVQHRRTFLTAGLAMVALAFMRGAREILIPLRGDDIGLDVAEIGIIFGVSSAIDMTFFYPVGVVMDRFGRKWSAVPSLLTLALALALVPLADSLVLLLLVGLLAGIGNGMGSGINMTLGTDLAPRQRPAEFLGTWRLIGDLGRVASPFAIGFITQAVVLGAAAGTVAGVGALGAVIMAFFVRETLRPARGVAPSDDAVPRPDKPDS
jgi:MFS family permease